MYSMATAARLNASTLVNLGRVCSFVASRCLAMKHQTNILSSQAPTSYNLVAMYMYTQTKHRCSSTNTMTSFNLQLLIAFVALLGLGSVIAAPSGPRPFMTEYPEYRSFNRISKSSTVTITATHKASVMPKDAAEYHCYDGRRIFVIAGSGVRANNTVHVYNLTDALNVAFHGSLDLILPGESEPFGEPNSCTAFNGRVYVVVTPFGAIGTARGKLMVYNVSTLDFIDDYDAGFNPDHVLYSPNKRFVVVADEGEPPQESPNEGTNPAGGATVLDTQTGDVCSFQFDFSGYTDEEFAENRVHESLKVDLNMTFDIEPEFVSFDPQNNTKAYLTCQEANVIVEIDIRPDTPCTSEARVIAIRPLGWKDYRDAFPNNSVATTDRYANDTIIAIQDMPFRNSPLYGMYQPDGTKGFVVNGKTYFITANEGDSKDKEFFGSRDEVEIRDVVSESKLNRTLNPLSDWSPYTTASVATEGNMRRLMVLAEEGVNPDDSNVQDFFVGLGGRGFSIWAFNPDNTTLVFESGDSTEKELQEFLIASPTLINQRVAMNDRSRRKGSEPENALTFTTSQGRTIALVAFERASTIGFYDVSNPAAPESIAYVSHPDLMGPEGITIVNAADSPSGKVLLIANGEGTGLVGQINQRLMVWELRITEPTTSPTRSPTIRVRNSATQATVSYTVLAAVALIAASIA